MKGKSIIKTITYRLGAVLITISICSIYKVPIEISTLVGILIEIAHTGYYYIHEKLWERYEIHH